jgi:hypothetical protein
MRVESGTTCTFRVLLVGADFYFPSALPGGGSYRSLGGCVRDVTRVEQMLRARVQGPLDLEKLTASNFGAEKPPEPEGAWPTFANLVAALERLVARTQPGDQVYVHYSGHGGRVRTAWPERKGADGFDETIVPIDIGLEHIPYLRDLDVAAYLDRLVHERGARVTFVLDSCHSGDIMRGDIAARSATDGTGAVTVVDPTPRPAPEGAALAAQQAAWTRLAETGRTSRAAPPVGFLPEASGYVLLAACRAVESALEASIDGAPRGGVLTAAYLRALDRLGADQTWGTLYEQILSWVGSRFPAQTPQLVGLGGRTFLSADDTRTLAVVTRQTANVRDVDAPGLRVKLDVGQLAGIVPGARFGVFRPGAVDGADPAQRVGTATVAETQATSSWAAFDGPVAAVELGAPALYEDVGTVSLRRAVAVVPRDDLPAGVDQGPALAALTAAIARVGRGFLVTGTPDTPLYQVSVDADAAYVIGDATGRPVPRVGPVAVGADDAAARVVERLVHLARYQTLLDLEDPPGLLKDMVGVTLWRPPAGWTAAQPREGGTPFEPTGDACVIEPDGWLFVRIQNRARQAINVVAFAFSDDWGIGALHPPPSSDGPVPARRNETIASGETFTFALQAYLPPERAETLDIIRIFATVDDVELWWILHPSIDQPITRSVLRGGGGGGALGAVRDALDADVSPRDLRPAATSPGDHWTVRGFRLLTRA